MPLWSVMVHRESSVRVHRSHVYLICKTKSQHRKVYTLHISIIYWSILLFMTLILVKCLPFYDEDIVLLVNLVLRNSRKIDFQILLHIDRFWYCLPFKSRTNFLQKIKIKTKTLQISSDWISNMSRCYRILCLFFLCLSVMSKLD